MQNQDYLKRQIEERKMEGGRSKKMSDAEYRLNKELLETIKMEPNKTHSSNKIF